MVTDRVEVSNECHVDRERTKVLGKLKARTPQVLVIVIHKKHLQRRLGTVGVSM